MLTRNFIYVKFDMRGMGQLVTVLLICLQYAKAIDITTVFHNPSDIFYINPSAGEIRLKTERGNVIEAGVVIDSQLVKMEIVYSEENFDYFMTDMNPFDTTLTYHFVLKDTSDTLKFPVSGEFKASAPLFVIPDWATGKTYYSIFVDGFYNGSLANDPEEKLAWGGKPENWRPYGGDLRGIIKKIAYIDSLDPDIIILQPIFKATSNHKLNPNDYATIDPSFGDTLDLKNLIDELHDRNKKVILNVTCSHTGKDFSVFNDIIRKSDTSKYLDWYLINSTPLTMSPPSYECWRSDHRFPRLNLQNPDVINYLIGYLEYWKHFGFDGFYIGESKTIDADFIKTLRSYLKSKYPDFLFLGSSVQFLKGEGFDGYPNRVLTELIIKYFIKNRMTTSEFDSNIRKLLFFNLPQANCANLLNLSTNDVRIHHTANGASVKNLFAFIFTFLGSPVILYGDEIGMSESAPLNLGSFKWDPEEQNRAFLENIKELIQIRKTNPQICNKYFFTLYVNDINKVYAYDRGGLIVILNSGEVQSFVKIPAWDGVYFDLVSGDKFIADSQVLRLTINPNSYRILKRET